MPATIAQARDQMCGRLKTDVDASTHANLVLIWDDVETQPPTDPTVPWARVKINHTTGRQSALAGANGKRRYTRGGIIIVQLFTPGGKGNVVSDEILAIILAAYEGKTTVGGLEFRNVRHQEIGQDGPWFQVNIFVDFRYDEIK